MDERTQSETEPSLSRPEEAIPDLEPDEHDAEAVKGGAPSVQFKDFTFPSTVDTSSP